MEKIWKWSEIEPKAKQLDGERIEKFQSLVGKHFMVRQFLELTSDKFEGKGFVVIQLEMQNKLYTAITGSGVLRSQLRNHADKIPFETTLAYVKNRYYSFSDEKTPA